MDRPLGNEQSGNRNTVHDYLASFLGRKKMRSFGIKWAIAAVSLAVLVTATGCDQHMQVASAKELQGVGPITLAMRADHLTPTLRSQLDHWNNSHPDQTVSITSLPADPAAARNAVTSSAANGGGSGSVVELPYSEVTEFADHNWITSLPESHLALDKTPSAVNDSVHDSDALYAVPFSLEVGVLYYRADLLSKAGLQPPSSWSDVADDCAKAAAPAHLGCLELPMASGDAITSAVTDAISSSDGELVDSTGAPQADTPQAREGIASLTAQVANGTITPSSLTDSPDAARSAFTSGKLLFLRDTAAHGTSLTSAHPGRGTVAVSGIPSEHGGGVVTTEGTALAVSANAEHQQTAMSVISYLADPSNADQRTVADGTANAYPQRWDAATLHKYPALAATSQAISGAKPCLRNTRYASYRDVIADEVGKALHNQESADTAASALQNRLEELQN